MFSLHYGNSLAKALPGQLAAATSTLRLAMYQLSPQTTGMHAAMTELWQELRAAPLRGVQCSALLYNGGSNTGIAESNKLACSQLRAFGWTAYLSAGAKIMHAKQCVIDGKTLLIGSHNWTTSGLIQNNEASIILESYTMAGEAAAWHDALLAEI